MLDDLRWDELNWMPNVRRYIADRGVTFRNSFSPYPLCCPARASFLTGQYAHNHEVYSHNRPYGFRAFRDRRTLATALQKAGYHTSIVGKYLNGYGRMWTHAGQHDSSTYVPPGWDNWAVGVELSQKLPSYHPLAGDMYDYFDTTTNENGVLVPHEGEYNTELFGRLAARSLQESVHSGKPTFLYLSLLAPHHGDPYEYDDPLPRKLEPTEYAPEDTPGDTLPADYYTPARPEWIRGKLNALVPRGLGIARPGAPEEDLSTKPHYLRSWPPLDAVDLDAVRQLTVQRAEALVAADVEIGKLIAALKESQRLDETLLVFTSDNGFFLGEHRQREGKVKPHDPALRVPLIVAGPGIPAGELRDDPATTVDLTATLLDFAGARPPHLADGASLRPVIEAGDSGWDRPVPYEASIVRVPTRPGAWRVLTAYGVRTARWAYVLYATEEAELYDLKRDPEELVNLSGTPELAEIERVLRETLGAGRACRGAECLRPLPETLQIGPRAGSRLADAAWLAHLSRFGTPYPLTLEGERTLLAGGTLAPAAPAP